MGWKDKIGSALKKWSEPIPGIEGPEREKARFKKGDRVQGTSINKGKNGTVYRAVEWGDDTWKYGVKWDDGDVNKATWDVEPLKEIKVKDVRKIVREGLMSEASVMSLEEQLFDVMGDLYWEYKDSGMPANEALDMVISQAEGFADVMMSGNDPDLTSSNIHEAVSFPKK